MGLIEIVRPVGSGLLAPTPPGQVTELVSEEGRGSIIVVPGNGDIVWNDDGVTQFSENRFLSSLTEEGWSVNSPDLVSLVSDATVPHYGDNVAQKEFPVGMIGGGGTAMNRDTDGTPTTLHCGVLMKVSSNFRQHASGITKIFYTWSAGQSKLILSANGADLELQVLLRHSPGDTSYMGPNLVPASEGQLTREQWHKIEFRVQSASASEMGASADGRARVWLDDVLVSDFDDLDTHFDAEDLHFSNSQWNTIWGGQGDEVTVEDGDMHWWAGALYQGGA